MKDLRQPMNSAQLYQVKESYKESNCNGSDFLIKTKRRTYICRSK